MTPMKHAHPAALVLRRRAWLALAAASLAMPSRATTPSAPRVLVPRPLVFPRDHGSHNDTRTEWWYLTGHAQAEGAPDDAPPAWGFQVTFFRSRVDSSAGLDGRLAARQLLFAHAAITDVAAGRLIHAQRIARWNGLPPTEATDARAVFASEADTAVHLRGWSFVRDAGSGAYRTRVEHRDLAIELTAQPSQPLLLQGSQGFSRKGPDPAQASFYVSHPQLTVTGTLRAGERERQLRVQGQAWLDHEWSEALMHPEAVGWDWTGMNLSDGSSLTAFRLRRADGSTVWTGGSWRSGTPGAPGQSFDTTQVRWTPGRLWHSPRTGAAYPVEWQLDTPAGRFAIRAMADAQELDDRASTGAIYWEGLSELLDASCRVVGRGYLEMTGYARRLVL